MFAGEEGRIADGDVGGGEQPVDRAAGVVAVPEADHQVVLRRRGGIALCRCDFIGVVDGCPATREPEVDVGVGPGKASEAGNQPTGSEGRWGANGDDAAGFLASGSLDRCDQTGESFLHLGQHGGAFGGEFQGSCQAVKQAQVEELLQQLDLMAHRRRRHSQFVSSLLEAQVPRGSFEGAERIQGGQAMGHG